MHYSTDYVFNGTGDRAWTEADPTAPLNAYGASKLAGEQAITAQHAKHLIFRASWVFDTWGGNFLKSILRAAQQRDSLNVVNDQFGAPTRAALMADVTAHVLRYGPEFERRIIERAAGSYVYDAAGQPTRDKFKGAACFPLAATPKQIGESCTYLDECADGLQCNNGPSGDKKCHPLCTVGAPGTCPTGETCNDSFAAGRGNPGLCF